jgi:hypothetical protein
LYTTNNIFFSLFLSLSLSPLKRYLYTRNAAQIGMKLDIRVIMKHGLDEANHVTGSLTGKITEVGGLPTDKQLKRSSSFVYGKRCSCNDHANCDFTQSGTRAEILKKYHCLHGQEVKGVVSLPDQYQNLDPLKHFFRGTKKKYEVTLRCNDNQQNMVSYNNNIAPCTLVFYSKKHTYRNC